MIEELTSEQRLILKRIVFAAPQIRNNGQLRRILRKIDVNEREAFYQLLKPHLQFKVWPYSAVTF